MSIAGTNAITELWAKCKAAFAAITHAHGNITNGGDITATATIASGDRLVINDESASKVTNSSITFGSSTSTFLRNDGTWATPAGGGGGNVDLRELVINQAQEVDGAEYGALWYDAATYDMVCRGILPVEQGGTGVDGTNSGLNAGEFFASSPTPVNPMDIGFRRIVASDLPDLSGTYLPLATSRTANTVLAAPNGSNGAASFRSLVEADLPSDVQTKLDTIQSTNTEIRITSGNDLLRLVLTTGNNLRVDTRASTSDSWATLYYPAVAPIDETTTANVITQTSTQSTNNPITSASYHKRYSTAMVEVKFKPAAARSANNTISLGTIVSGKRPQSLAFGGSAVCMGEVTTAGAVTLRVRTALTANTEYTVGFTYLV